MTETAVENTEATENTESTETVEAQETAEASAPTSIEDIAAYDGPSPVGQNMLPQAAKLAAQLAELRKSISKGTGVEKQRRELIKNSERDDFKKLREIIANAQNKLNELAKAEIPEVDTNVDKDSVKEEIKVVRKEFNEFVSVMRKNFQFMPDDAETVKGKLDALVSAAGVSSTATSVARPRVKVTVHYAAGDQTYDSISKAGQAIKGVSGKDIREAYAEARGVDVTQLSDFNDATTTFQVGKGDSALKVTTSPKPKAESTKADSESDDTDDETDDDNE